MNPGTSGSTPPSSILVADDDPVIRMLFRKTLTCAGYRVFVANDGVEALEQLRTAEFDLLITDLVMPNMEGLELIQTIRKEQPQLKIIAMSGRFVGQFLLTAELLGAQATLAKPIRSDVLLETVRRVMSG
jgi:CheY-like chemotaxis protein